MLQFYIPEVKSVEQVKDEADKVIDSEFDRLEKSLQQKNKEIFKEEWSKKVD